MSYKKFKNKSEVEIKCSCDQQHSSGFEKKSYHENESRLQNNEIVSSKKYENEPFNSNAPSSSSLNKILFNSSKDKNVDFPMDDMCHRDIPKIGTIATHLEKDEGNIKFDNLKISKPCDDDIGNFDGIPFSTNSPSHDNDQANIVDCLLDLDDYLKKMDDDCIMEDNTDLNSERPNVTMAKSTPSSIRIQKPTKAVNPFERSSKLRRTIDCSMYAQSNSPEHEPLSIQGTWNKKTAKHQHENSSDNVFIDVNGESSNVSADVEEIQSSQSTNTAGFELTNPCGKVLTNEQIFQNLIEQQLNVEIDRPRQYGRRAERVSTFSSRLNDSTVNFTRINNENLRPTGVNATASIAEVGFHNETMYTGSDGSTTRSSRNTTPVSIESTTDSGESLSISETLNTESNAANHDNDQLASQSIDTDVMNTIVKNGFNSYWPHDHSRSLALISCTLGLFNTSRFATLTINYGGNFLIQFCILSIIFGIPFLWLQMSLGAKISAGPISMWRISPICVGIGISITLVQYFITIYSTVALAWLLKFIQDIFIYKTPYVWSESLYFPAKRETSHAYSNLTESVPYYFNVNVLQRIKLLKIHNENGGGFHINDHIAFYLVFVWAAVFLILCKGLKSFGKWILFLGVLPIVLLTVIAIKLLCVVDIAKLQNLLSSSEFDDFLVNSKTWAAAAQETFLTWGLLGASVISISSRTQRKPSKFTLRKDAIFVVIVTFIGLALSALVGLCSVQILSELDYVYVPGSYETPEHYFSIFSLKSSNTGSVISYPTKLVPHYSTLVGEVYRRHTDTTNISGYQVLRFLTELLPAAVAVSTENMSWIWTLILYIAFFLFGLSQLCVMWKPISCVLGNSTTIIFESCTIGLLLSIPFVTELGITILYFMDILLGGAWFIPILWCAEIFGIFLIRGRPYNGDDLVNDLKMSGSMSAFLALSWNILLPIGLITLAIIEYKISLSNQFFHWRGNSYFNSWSRKTGATIQIGILIFLPISAIIQICRYLTSGPPDILDRIQMLYRPLDEDEAMQTNLRSNRNTNSSSQGNNQHSADDRFQNDAPPKYTPPPSYTTATGAKLAKILRQSFRRSVRRLLGESESLRPVLPIPRETPSEQTSDPATEETSMDISETIEFESRPSVNFIYGRSLSLGRKQILNKCRLKETNGHHPSERPHNFDSSFNRRSSYKLQNRPFTAEDVKTILRSSTFGRRVPRSAHLDAEPTFRSIENLVQNAEPPNIITEIVDERDRNDRIVDERDRTSGI